MENLTPKQRRRLASQRRRLHNVLLAGIFLLLVLVAGIINLCTKTKAFSETENRSLAQMPAFSWSTLRDGSYFAGLTDCYNDQFFARDSWISLKSREESLLGRKESGGVFLGTDGYLIGSPETPDEIAVANTAAAINQFAADHPEVSMRLLAVPGAASVLTERLPKNAPVRDQVQDMEALTSQLSDQVRGVDVSAMLKRHASEYIYYKTDHHWTSLGARYAFEAASSAMGIQPISDYQVFTVASGFEGTLASKSGSHRQTDYIDIYVPNSTVEYYVVYPDSGEKTCSMYRSDCLTVKDQYTVFFGGNHPLLEIYTTANTGRSLLIFKDSYANSFVQFLTPYYDKIILIDPRYYYDSVATVMNSYGITDVLFLYSGDTLLQDTSLTDVLTSAAAETAQTAEPLAITPTEPTEQSAAEPIPVDILPEEGAGEPASES